MVTALLHDGQTVSYTGEGYCTGRGLTMGHGLLGVELIRNPLGALPAAQPDLGDALGPAPRELTAVATIFDAPRRHLK